MANQRLIPQPKPLTPAPREPLQHLAALDGVRGLAIVLVLVYHLLWANQTGHSPGVTVLLQLRGAAWVGVDLFFTLSGFLITGILFDTQHDPHYFRNFYLRRILRTFPLYYVVIFTLALLLWPAGAQERRQLISLFAYLQNTSLYWHGPATRLESYTGHLWSLAVEEQFYLVWPLLVFLLRRRRTLLWTSVLLAALALVARYAILARGAGLDALYHLTICRADSLFAGAWLALIARGPARDRVLRLAPAGFVAALLICTLILYRTGTFSWQHNRSVALYGYSIVAVLSTSLIAWALQPRSIAATLLRGRVLRFFGRYSYGIYVFHLIVAPVVSHLRPWLSRYTPSNGVPFHLFFFAVDLALTLLLAMVSFHSLEAPFLRLKSLFHDRSRPLEHAPTAA